MKAQPAQKKGENRSHAESLSSGQGQSTQLKSSVNNSPLMTMQRRQKESVQLAAEKKKPGQKKADEKKKK